MTLRLGMVVHEQRLAVAREFLSVPLWIGYQHMNGAEWHVRGYRRTAMPKGFSLSLVYDSTGTILLTPASPLIFPPIPKGRGWPSWVAFYDSKTGPNWAFRDGAMADHLHNQRPTNIEPWTLSDGNS